MIELVLESVRIMDFIKSWCTHYPLHNVLSYFFWGQFKVLDLF